MRKKNILIVGSNERSRELANELLQEPNNNLVGFADDVQIVEMSIEKVCGLSGIKEYIMENALDQVLITLPIRGFYDSISEILFFCSEKQIKAEIASKLFDINYNVAVEPPHRNSLQNKWIECSNNILLFLKKNRHPQEHRVLIVGMKNLRALSLAESIRQPGSGYKFIGYVEDSQEDILKGMPVECSFAGFKEYISKNPIDEVIFSLPIRSFYDKIKNMTEDCKKQGVIVKIIDDFFGKKNIIPQYINRDAQSKLVDFKINNRSLLQYDLKWLFDRTASFFFLLLFFPFFFLIAFAVILDDGFPVFYAQERIGRNKRRFKMIKFRTMIKNAEKMQAELESKNEIDKGVAFKITNDPRVTKLGKWLRKTSLDELPQLFNVLKADMSLVGPRPLPVRDFEKFYDDCHRRRFSVDPGITGPWQISGRSDNIDFEKWMNLDLAYIDHWNIMLDFKILLKTIPAVLFCKGAK